MTTLRETPISQSKPFEKASIEAFCAGKAVQDALHYMDRDIHNVTMLEYCGGDSLVRAHKAGGAREALRELVRARTEITRLTDALNALEPLLVKIAEG